jgi:hypothetical protein
MATAGALFIYLADEIGEQAWLTQVDLPSVFGNLPIYNIGIAEPEAHV